LNETPLAQIKENKMKKYILIPIAIFVFGCSTTATLFPTEGPMSKQMPIPTIDAKVKGILGNSGDMYCTLPDGEVCKGKWSVVAPVSAGFVQGSLLGTYASAYGIQTSGKENRGQAMLFGNKGTSIEIEFLVGSGTASGYGVAKDNKGNVFRVLF
jgi:hypothetical protein